VDFGAEDYRTWPYSRLIKLNTAAAGIRESLVDFVLLIRLDSTNFDFRTSLGKDLRFSASGGRHLPYQVDHWDGTGRSAAVWIKLDTLMGNSQSQSIEMHWGRSDAPDFSSGRSVFGAYAGAWHLDGSLLQPGESRFPDASPSDAPGEGTALPRGPGFVIGKGAHFEGGRYARAQGEASLRPDSQLTLSTWFKLPRGARPGAALATYGDNYGLRIHAEGGLYFFIMPDTADLVDPLPPEGWKICVSKGVDLRDGAWHHAAGVYDGSAMRIYADGVELAALPFREKLGYPKGPDFFLGIHGNGLPNFQLTGDLDEVRVSGRPHSPARVKAEYENQKPGSTLVIWP
jgi:hypothetical protein